MRLPGKKVSIIVLVTIFLLVSFTWIGQIESEKKNYTETVRKVEKDFEQLIDMTEAIIADENISFEEFTEQYTQLRVRLSKWNHLYTELQIWDETSANDTCSETSVGEFYLEVENLYFNLVHMYYIGDVVGDEIAIVEQIGVLEAALQGLQGYKF